MRFLGCLPVSFGQCGKGVFGGWRAANTGVIIDCNLVGNVKSSVERYRKTDPKVRNELS